MQVIGRIGTKRARSTGRNRDRIRKLVQRIEGPSTLLVPLQLYTPGKIGQVAIERSWRVECSSPEALAYARKAIADCIRGLDGTILRTPD